MFVLDNKAIMEAKEPKKTSTETSAISGLRRGNDVTVWKRGTIGKRGVPSGRVTSIIAEFRRQFSSFYQSV